ncbi:MAG: RagB/SusD family nutrient uptake outer membrane protein, partial [Cyclobacteriaceae bacterium]
KDSRMLTSDEKGTNSGFIIKKYIEDEPYVAGGLSTTDWIALRLAEMYLTRAEAEFELGNHQEAADALNATRERAGISLVDAGTITMDRIRNERKVELSYEQHRWWDLKRWRLSEELLNGSVFSGLRIIYHFASDKYYFLPIEAEVRGRIFRPEHYYNPITDDRINNNADLVENPMY